MAYTKQTWSDLPSTTSPYNATRMNHIEDGISATYDKASITIYEGSDGTSTSAFGTVAAPTDNAFSNIGNKFTFSNNSVVAPSGMSLVRVSGVLCGTFTNNSSSTPYTIGARIIKDGTAQNILPRITIKPNETLNVAIPVTPYVTSITSGQTLQIGIYSSTANVTKTPKEGTYLCVEEVK